MYKAKTYPCSDRHIGSPQSMCSHLRYSNPEIWEKALKTFKKRPKYLLLITFAIITSIWELRKTLYSSESRKQIIYKPNTQDTCLIPCCHLGILARALGNKSRDANMQGYFINTAKHVEERQDIFATVNTIVFTNCAVNVSSLHILQTFISSLPCVSSY